MSRRRHDFILQLLRTRDEYSALSVTELHRLCEMEGFKVTLRTIRRDIDSLSLDGITEVEGNPSRFYLSSDYELTHQFRFNEQQLHTLILAINNLKHTTHHYFENHLSDVENIILNSLPKETVAQVLEQKNNYCYDFSITGRPSHSDYANFDLIFQALKEKRYIKCKNASPYKDQAYNQKIRKLLPVKFILSSNIPYIFCYDLSSQQYKRFRVNRLSEISLLDVAEGEYHLDDKLLKASIGGFGNVGDEGEDIKIHCGHQMAYHFLEKEIHHSQKVSKLEDGLYEVSFKCVISHDLVRLIASYGSELEAIYPESLSETVRAIWTAGLKKTA